MSETDKIIHDAQLGAATETAIEEMQALMGVDRAKAIAMLTTVSVGKETVVSEILSAGASGGMAAMVDAIKNILFVQLSIQLCLKKLSE